MRTALRRTPDDASVTKPLPIATGDDDAELADDEAPSPSPAHKPDNGEGDDRWAGTMAHDWTAPAEDMPAKHSKRKPRLSVAEASARVPAPLKDYLKNVFKCEIDKVRDYEPSVPAKQDAPAIPEQAEETIPGDPSGDESA